MSSRQRYLCFEIPHPPANAFYRLAGGKAAVAQRRESPEALLASGKDAADAAHNDTAEPAATHGVPAADSAPAVAPGAAVVDDAPAPIDEVAESISQPADQDVDAAPVAENDDASADVAPAAVASETDAAEADEAEKAAEEEAVEEEEEEEKEEENVEEAEKEESAVPPLDATPTAPRKEELSEDDLPLFTAQAVADGEDERTSNEIASVAEDTSFVAARNAAQLISADAEADLTFATAADLSIGFTNDSLDVTQADNVVEQEQEQAPQPIVTEGDEEEEAAVKVAESVPAVEAAEIAFTNESEEAVAQVAQVAFTDDAEEAYEAVTDVAAVAAIAAETGFTDLSEAAEPSTSADKFDGIASEPSEVLPEPSEILTEPSEVFTEASQVYSEPSVESTKASDLDLPAAVAVDSVDTSSPSPAAGPAFRTRSRKSGKMAPKVAREPKTNGTAASADAAPAAAAPTPAAAAPTAAAKATAPSEDAAAAGPAKRVPAPDEQKHKSEVAAATDKIDTLMKQQEEINAKIRAAGNINDSFSAKNAALTARQNELRTLVTSLRAEVGDTRRQRESQQRETEALRKSLPYQTTEEIDRAISDLEKRIASGSLKLVDERKCVQEISTLKRARGGAETLQKKTTPSSASSNANSAKEAQLDQAIAELDALKKEFNTLRDTRSAEYDALGKMRTESREISTSIRQLMDQRSQLISAYNKNVSEHRKYAQEEANRRREEERLFRQQASLERKKALEEKRREERTLPKFVDKIDMCANLSKYLQEVRVPRVRGERRGAKARPDLAPRGAAAFPGPAGLPELQGRQRRGQRRGQQGSGRQGAAQGAGRLGPAEPAWTPRADASDRDEDFFGSVAKKQDKSAKPKKAAPKAPETVRLPLGMVEQILSLDVPLPTTVTDVDNTLQALAEKRAFYERRQAEEIRKGEEEERAERELESQAHEDATEDATAAAEETTTDAAAAVADAPDAAEEKEEGEL